MPKDSATKIQILPDFIANQIAAGEVVEGPNSIIKELFENSVDANATKIDINITKNLLKIELTDNGDGIAKEEISLAFKKHATSKISTIEDLQKLATNGFRGEALASIASVSKLTCISRTRDSELATKFYTANGQEEITETGSGFGTKIIVDDLFFNTPVRLKFLKSDSREKNLIIDTCRGLALANPSIKVNLNIDGKNILESSGSSKINSTIEEIFKNNISKDLLPIKASEGQVSIEGFCSKLSNTRTDKRGVISIVNNRYLDCYIIKSAINSIYKDLLSKGKYPIVVLKITMPTEDLDINVHPNKKEIKYREANKIYRLVQNALDKALRTNAYKAHEESQSTNFIRPNDLNSSDLIQARLDTFSVSKTDIDHSSLKDDFKTYNNYPKAEFNFKSQQDEEVFDFNSSKFLARFGSIDLKLVPNTDVQTITSSQGNKTKFEYAHKDFKDNQSIIFSGEFIGENWIKEKLFNFLSELGDEIFIKEKNKTPQNKSQSRPQVKPKNSVLEKIWQRDNYTCVYCSKALLHPALIKEKLINCTKPNELNKHLASFDHHLPASKYTELNIDEENLFAVCQECNIKKSNSLASKTWQPKRSNAWHNNNSILIAELKIDKPTLN